MLGQASAGAPELGVREENPGAAVNTSGEDPAPAQSAPDRPRDSANGAAAISSAGAEAEDDSQIAKRQKAAFTPEQHPAQVSGIMSTAEFASLQLTEQTQRTIAEMGFVRMTEVQARTIPPLLAGRDVLGAAKTGALVAQ